MSYNLDTPQGMKNDIDWTNTHLDRLKDGGTWLIPRSMSMATVISHTEKTVAISGLFRDAAVERVLKEAGWTTTKETK